MCRQQAIRKKLLNQLDGLLQLAISTAKGEVKHFRDDKGKKHPITAKQREKWALIPAYVSQVMTNLTD